jgi:PIN domain nuclease of toxin-antitoxin system
VSRVLLDTHVFLFLAANPKRVPPAIQRAVNDAEERYLSAASAWEIAVKAQLGKLRLPEAPAKYVRSRASKMMLVSLPVTQAHALRVYSLPMHHRDPFDRLLIAQALEEQLTLLTVDRKILRYDVETFGLSKRRR